MYCAATHHSDQISINRAKTRASFSTDLDLEFVVTRQPCDYHSAVQQMIARPSKCAAVSIGSALGNTGILQIVLSYVGPGHWLFLSAVCSEWKVLYERLAAVNVFAFTASGKKTRLKCEPRMTLSSAVFQSSRLVRLAHQHGLRFNSNYKMHHVAGKVADRHVLATAHELGMPLSSSVLLGASERGSLTVLRWLHFDMGCALPRNITVYAARGGGVRVMQWLSERGCVLTTKTQFNAAKYRRISVLNYLHGAGCPMDDGGRACKIAAWNGSLQVLQWLRSHGCPWVPLDVTEAAAHSGNVQMMAWLQQQPGVVFTAAAMSAAARANRQEMCEFLHSQDCAWH
jgi:hypothetical protein